MPKLSLLLLLFLNRCVLRCSATAAKQRENASSEAPDFEAWRLLHKKSYSSAEEEMVRESIWIENTAFVEKHNEAYEAGLTAYRMTAASPFADLTALEFEELYLMEPQQCSATATTTKTRLRPLNYDDSMMKSESLDVDWRTHGVITPIKNQGRCGSCWSFSTTGCLEAHLCLQGHRDCSHWTGLAEQQLLDCAGAFNNFGCNGGLPSQAFEYIKYNDGIDLESTYPYHATSTSSCQASNKIDDDDTSIGGKVAEVFNITARDEHDLEYAVANVGPVSIAYQVSADFRFYSHGIYDSYDAKTNTTICENGPQDVNHAVVAVGLGTSGSTPYYIIRNSWGKLWGMEGYFWMKRGENLCGVSDCASFPLVPYAGMVPDEGSLQI